MHRGAHVYAIGTSRKYHYTDDGCPQFSAIRRGQVADRRIKEVDARASGLTLCRHCANEYREGRGGRSIRHSGVTRTSRRVHASLRTRSHRHRNLMHGRLRLHQSTVLRQIFGLARPVGVPRAELPSAGPTPPATAR